MRLGCADFERLTGMPHVACCLSCIEDARMGIPICEMYGTDDLGPNVPRDASFSICCAHFNAYEDAAVSPSGRSTRQEKP